MKLSVRSSKQHRLELLDGGFEVRIVADEADVLRVAAFNGAIHGHEVAAMTRCLFLYHPRPAFADLFFVEDVRSREVVSSLCLIPWLWRFEGVDIVAGEMGIVGTSEAYRRRGLIRAQVSHFKHRLAERVCLMSHIQGIPYYYRQFGYEYALPLEGGLRLEVRDIPDPSGAPYGVRRAALDDLPTLRRLYDGACSDLAIHAVRDRETWQYLLTHAQETVMACERWLVEEPDGDAVGYFALPRHHFGEELTVSEVSSLSYEAALSVLHHLKQLTIQRNKPGIRLRLPAGCTLARLARSMGALDPGTYQWQVHIPNPVTLLRALKPVLERRVAESALGGLTRHVRISLYRTTMLLRFDLGTLRSVADVGLTEGEAIRIPPPQFVPLVLGYRTREELQACYPDVGVAPDERMLVDVLFPKVESFLYTTY